MQIVNFEIEVISMTFYVHLPLKIINSLKTDETYLTNNGNKVLVYYLKKNKIAVKQLARLLGVSSPTIYKYLKNPFNLQLGQLILIAGYFRIDFMLLIHLLDKNKDMQPKGRDKVYLHDIFSQGSTLYGSISR